MYLTCITVPAFYLPRFYRLRWLRIHILNERSFHPSCSLKALGLVQLGNSHQLLLIITNVIVRFVHFYDCFEDASPYMYFKIKHLYESCISFN